IRMVGEVPRRVADLCGKCLDERCLAGPEGPMAQGAYCPVVVVMKVDVRLVVAKADAWCIQQAAEQRRCGVAVMVDVDDVRGLGKRRCGGLHSAQPQRDVPGPRVRPRVRDIEGSGQSSKAYRVLPRIEGDRNPSGVPEDVVEVNLAGRGP